MREPCRDRRSWTRPKSIWGQTARTVMAATIVASALLAPPPGTAQGGNPFARFLGIWRGYGQVITTNGNAEPVNCRASYLPEDSNNISLTLVCATESYRIEIRSELVAFGHEVQGNWIETSHQVTGSLAGQIEGGSIEGNVTGPGFSAEMSLRSNGRRQYVSIRPQGGRMQVADVEINLSREVGR
jgi:hypothetical protein